VLQTARMGRIGWDTEPMSVERIRVGIVVERQRVEGNPWLDHRWVVVQVLPGAPDVAPWTKLDETPARTRWYAGPANLDLYSRETATLKHNLESSNPSVYVMLRKSNAAPGVELLGATVDAGEAHAHADTGDDQVDPLPIPEEIRVQVADFIARHHVDRPTWKRKNDRADPEALARRAQVPTYPWEDDA
jgi:Protein of unknown function (DUF3305)